jgi:hypothetical protein
MNLKRITSAGLALTMTAALGVSALAADKPEGWTPADGARGPMLISANPNAGGYDKVITVNGQAVESFEFSKDVPGWGSEQVTLQFSEIPNVPAGYVPLRAVIQADKGSAYWDSAENTGSFYHECGQIVVSFDDMSILVEDEKVEDAEALLLEGVTYVPVSVLEKLEGITVTDKSTDDGESFEITTPNGTPLMMMASSIMETAEMGRGMKSSIEEMEQFWGEAHGFKAEYMTEGVAFMPMMTSPDTLVLGKFDEDNLDALKESLESYRKQQEETFTWYLGQNLPKVQAAQFVTEGDWFMFLIAENVDEGVKTFQAAVAEMDAE